MSPSEEDEAWMVSVVFQQVRERITGMEVHYGSMFGAETVRDVTPHTITNHHKPSRTTKNNFQKMTMRMHWQSTSES